MLETAIEELKQEIRNNTVALTHLITLLSKTGVPEQNATIVPFEQEAKEGPQTGEPEAAEEPVIYHDEAHRNAKLDLAHNYIPEVPEGTDTKLVPLVKGQTGLPEGERNKAYYEANIRPQLAALAKLNPKEVKNIFAFYEYEAKKEGREFPDLSAVPTPQWDELYGRVKLEIHRAEHPEELKQQVAEARAEAKAEIAKAEEAAKPLLPEGERNADFYAQHVRPELYELVKINSTRAKAIVDSYGVKRGDQIPATEWENVILAVRAELAEIKAGA